MLGRINGWLKQGVVAAGLAGSLMACGGSKESEFKDALPDRDVATVAFPAGTSASGLSTSTSRSGLVGGPADLYTHSYYASRDLNALGAHVIDILDAITKTRPTALTSDKAVWGPFSGDGEPNEFRLGVDRTAPGVYTWVIQGRHKGGSESDFANLAAGRFEPALGPYGKGVFAIDFEAIHALNPTDGGHGKIAYAFERNQDGVLVAAEAEVPDASGQTQIGKYAYGKNTAGEGFIIFAIPANIDSHPANENMVIKTRWLANGEGRADVMATDGDLAGKTANASQCWNTSYVSTYEMFSVDGATVTSQTNGDPASCVLPAGFPSPSDLPNMDPNAAP